MGPVRFEPFGPFRVEYTRDDGVVVFDHSKLWKSIPELAERRGVYIFAVKRGKAMIPFYVGETKVTFKKETFQPHKLAHYREAIGKTKNWTTHLYLIAQPRGKKPNTKFITAVEHFFIRVAWKKNPAIRNIKGVPEPEWSIPGVTEPHSGKPSQRARRLRSLLGLTGRELHAGQRRPQKGR